MSGPDEKVEFPEDSLILALDRALRQAEERILESGIEPPLTLHLLDANARCIAKVIVEMTESGPTRRTESGELPERNALPFPWFVVVMHRDRQVATVRIGFLKRGILVEA